MNKTVKRNALALLTCLMWSTAFCGTRYIGEALSAQVIALIRVISASALLIIVWRFRKDRKAPERKDLIWFVLSGAAGFAIYLIFFSQGLLTITGAESSVIIALTPVIVAVLSTILYREKLGAVRWFATIGAFIGVALLMLWDSGLEIRPGMIWTAAASMLFAVYNLISRKLGPKGYSSLDIVTFSLLFSAVMLIWILPEAVREISAASAGPVLAAVLLGLVPSAAAYTVWGRALRLADQTSQVTNYMFVTPLFATAEGILFLGEIPGTGTYLGGGIIIAMVILFNTICKNSPILYR